MSIHLLECAARLNLPPSTKLALMAFADSADRVTRVAFPGLDHVMMWSNLGRSRASEVVADLVKSGLLVKHRGGAWGRRAEYVVFPHGCCPAHAPLPDDSASALAHGPETTHAASGTPAPEAAILTGSGTLDPHALTESDPPDPTETAATASTQPDPAPAIGSDTGSDSYRTPPETPTTPGVGGVPAQPQTARGSERPADRDEHGPLHPTCPEHRDQTKPPACRRCRHWRTDFENAELARAAAASRARTAEFLEAERRAKADTAGLDTHAALAAVRSRIRKPNTGARR